MQRDKYRHGDTQADRQTDRLDRQSQEDRSTVHTCSDKHRQTGTQAYRQTDRQTDRQTGRQAGRQTDRQT